MRRCFFIFDYDHDLARAKQINDLGLVRGSAPAGFDDAAPWEEAKNSGDDAVRELIDDAMSGTSATIVLIGKNTANLDYVDYAIDRSIARNNGIVGFFVHDIPDESGRTSAKKGGVPYEAVAAEKLDAHHYDTQDWDPSSFAERVEDAATGWTIYARTGPLLKFTRKTGRS